MRNTFMWFSCDHQILHLLGRTKRNKKKKTSDLQQHSFLIIKNMKFYSLSLLDLWPTSKTHFPFVNDSVLLTPTEPGTFRELVRVLFHRVFGDSWENWVNFMTPHLRCYSSWTEIMVGKEWLSYTLCVGAQVENSLSCPRRSHYHH